MTLGRWLWISALGLGACSSAVPSDPVGTDRWIRCCGLSSSPWVRTRGTADYLECFCPAGSICNYEQTCWVRDAWEGEPLDAAASEAGFADAGPMDDVTLDALISNDTTNDGSTADDAATDAQAIR